VGKGRHRYGVQAPAVSGHPAFERLYRVQMNTLEWAVMTLPCLWICAAYVSDAVAAGLGGVWLAGRVGYAVAYAREPALRAKGFTVGAGLRRPGARGRRRRALELAGVLTMKQMIVLAALAAPAAAWPPPCRAGRRRAGLTVSGISSGGYMAVQFQVAFSKQVRGAGIIAAGPYDCAEGSSIRALAHCMSPSAWAPPPKPDEIRPRMESRARLGLIDPPEGLADDRVWMLGGGADHTVEPPVMDALEAFYRQWVPADALRRVSLPDAGHAMISVADGKPNACNTSEPPYINRCGDFDAPGELLGHLLGKLEAARAPEPAWSRPSTSGPSSAGCRPTSAWRSRASSMCRRPAGPAAAGCMWPSTAASRVRTRSAGASWKAPATTPGPRPTG
jgi:hypothetical protein